MVDSFVLERYSEEKAQKELFKERGIPPIIENPDIKVTPIAQKSEVYKVAEQELLKLKMKVGQAKEMHGTDRTQLANLIHILVSQGGAS